MQPRTERGFQPMHQEKNSNNAKVRPRTERDFQPTNLHPEKFGTSLPPFNLMQNQVQGMP